MKNIFIIILLFSGTFSFSQTKKELLIQVEAKNKSIDSLNKVIAGLDNLIETRDRTIKFLREDKVELNSKIEELYIKISGKNTELSNLRKQAETGKASLKLMTNSRSKLKVPEGKYWIINQFMTDYISDLKADSLGDFHGDEIHVFLKSIDGTILTDPAKNMYGPQVYSSIESNQSIQFPLIFTENTSFAVIVMKGKIGEMVEHPGKVYCSIIEKDK